MSLTSMLLNMGGGVGSSTRDFGSGAGYLKLPSLPKDETYFSIWKLKVEAQIRGFGLMEVLENKEQELHVKVLDRLNVYQREREDMKEQGQSKVTEVINLTQEQKDTITNRMNKVYAALAETLVTADQMRILLNKSNVPDGDAYQLWKAIKDRYDIRPSDASKERLWEIFNGMKMNPGDDFKTYKAKVEEAVANLYTVGEMVPETRIKAKLITGLSSQYGPFVGALYAQDYTAMNLMDLCKKINDFEESTVFKNAHTDINETIPGMTAMVKDYMKRKAWSGKGNERDKGMKCFTCNKEGHRAYYCELNKDKKRCINCKRIGHTTNECRYPKKENNNINNHDNKSKVDTVSDKKTSSDTNSDYFNFFAPVIPYDQHHEISSDTWLLDSGASRHLCTKKSNMENLRKPSQVIHMKCANRQLVKLNRIGEVTMKIKTNQRNVMLTLGEAAYAPTFQCNIVSVGKLTDAGMKVMFGDNGAVVFDGNMKPVMVARKVGKLYIISGQVSLHKVLDGINDTVMALKETNSDMSNVELWHQRLGHIGYSGLKLIINRGSVEGLNIKSIDDEWIQQHKCDSCIYGKQHRAPFGNEWRDKAADRMERAHADLCGPVQPTRNGECYLSTIIDEATRMIFGELIIKKSDAPQGIIVWCIKARTYTGTTLKQFHSDGGGEYRGKELLQFFQSEGTEVKSTLTQYTAA